MKHRQLHPLLPLLFLIGSLFFLYPSPIPLPVLAASTTTGSDAPSSCPCKQFVFPHCLIPAGANSPGLCSTLECRGWICIEDGDGDGDLDDDGNKAMHCHMQESKLPVWNKSRITKGHLIACDMEVVYIAVPDQAVDTTVPSQT